MLRRVCRLPATVWIVVAFAGAVVAGQSLLPLAVQLKANDDAQKRGGQSAETAYEKTLTVALGDGVTMAFVLIPAGRFTMGSPKDEKERSDDEEQHPVEITRPFYLAKYPVTQEQYQAVMGKNPSYFQAGPGGAAEVKSLDTKHFPVECVSWDNAQAFCKKIRASTKPGHTFRLPTEAEWEYACRAGTTTPFYFGSELNGKQANCNGSVVPYGTTDLGPWKKRTTKVGEYRENPWGLCDMHGNVWQWCEDYYGPYNDDLKATDPLRSVKYAEGSRVSRGGSWGHAGLYCRAAYRTLAPPDTRNEYSGFRVAFRLD
jgi:formylglycine-generating enzyme required for sulfatase activity